MGQRGQPPILGAVFLAFVAAIGGCAPKPLAPVPPPPAVRDAGLPAYDLKYTADRIATSLLADPKINANKKSWTLAVDRMNDDTANSAFSHDYDELLDRLRTALFQQSNGRAQLIEKRAAPSPPSPSPSPGPIAPPRDMQPDYLLYGQAADLPNRGNGFFQIDLVVTGAGSHSLIWQKMFDVHTGH